MLVQSLSLKVFYFLALLFMVGTSLPSFATTITVTTTDDELNEDGDCSLREAVQAANADAAVDACPAGSGDDVIELPAGLYRLTLEGASEDDNGSGDLDLRSNIVLNGAGEASTAVVGQDDRVLHGHAGASIEISDVTVTGGVALEETEGAGLLNEGTATLVSVTITRNGTEDVGGGIANTGTLTLISATISQNRNFGIRNAGMLDVINSTIRANRPAAELGGGNGIWNFGTLNITGSILAENACSECNGGGLRNSGTAHIANSIIRDNNAQDYGGGISNGGVLTLTNTTVSGNSSARGGGAGIFNGDWVGIEVPVLTITNSTITNNRGPVDTGEPGFGLYNRTGTSTIQNTILVGNFVPTFQEDPAFFYNDCLDDNSGLISAGNNLFGIGCPVTVADFAVDPSTVFKDVLLPLADNGGPTPTHALPPGSPAVDRGSCEAGTDQRGEMRPSGDACDIGAFERQASPPSAGTAPTAHWPLDERSGDTATDATGNGFDGHLFGDPRAVAGRFASARFFDGEDDFIRVDHDPSLDVTEAVTVSGWFFRQRDSGNATGLDKLRTLRLVSNRDEANTSEAFWYFDFWNAEGQFYRLTSTQTVPNDAWHHVAATFDGTEMRLYIDGVLDASMAAMGPIRVMDTPLEIGRRDRQKYYRGRIDEVFLFDRALSAAEIASLYDGEVPAAETQKTAGPALAQAAATAAAEAFTLEGNYPNPFNPETTIRFNLPEATPVRLEVFDMLGRRVALLADQTLEAGFHEVMWDSRDAGGLTLAGGTYVYRLQAGSFSQSKTMVMLK